MTDLEIINSYKTIQKNIVEICNNKGKKLSPILEKLCMHRSTFYRKKNNMSFLPDELENILKEINR